MGPVAVCLALTKKLRGLHPVFHVTLLCRYEPGGDGVKTSPPSVVDDKEEYKVKALFVHSVRIPPYEKRMKQAVELRTMLSQQRTKLHASGKILKNKV